MWDCVSHCNMDSTLGFQVAHHQVAQREPNIFASVEHGISFVDHRRNSVVIARQSKGSAGGRIAFGDGTHPGDNVCRRFAASDSFAESPVAAVPRKTGDHQVAKAAESGKRFELRTTRDAQPANFNYRTSDQRSLGIIAEAQSVADSSGDGDYIFERPPQLKAEQVGGRVNTKSGPVEQVLDRGSGRQIAAGGDDCRRHATRHFNGEGRPGKSRMRGVGRGLRENSTHGQAAFEFDAFGYADYRDFAAAEAGGDFAKRL